MTCWEQLGLVLAWEYQDAELRGEHFLTVAAYNLQHPAQFTDAALSRLRSTFIERLDNGVSVEEIRRQFAQSFEGNRRVLREAPERLPVLRSWSTTIADVYIPDMPLGAAARVRAWAISIRHGL